MALSKKLADGFMPALVQPAPSEVKVPSSIVDHRKEFLEEGFTRVPGFFTKEEMDSLILDIQTADPKQHQPSGLNVGELVFYDNLFSNSARIRNFISQPRLVDFLKTVIGPDFWVRWDQAVFKGPGGGEFPWHQDNAYNRLRDEHFQLWIALSKMNAERGGLWLVPGSHKKGRLPHVRIGRHQAFTGSTENSICIEAEIGDVVLFSSLMLHYTSPNVSTEDRWAYVVEYMSLDHHDPYMKPPFFVVARNGESRPGFVRFPRGRLSVSNHMKYLVPAVKEQVSQILKRVGVGPGVDRSS
jgi:hypothetical protein